MKKGLYSKYEKLILKEMLGSMTLLTPNVHAGELRFNLSFIPKSSYYDVLTILKKQNIIVVDPKNPEKGIIQFTNFGLEYCKTLL